jgi:hypothetical protein
VEVVNAEAQRGNQQLMGGDWDVNPPMKKVSFATGDSEWGAWVRKVTVKILKHHPGVGKLAEELKALLLNAAARWAKKKESTVREWYEAGVRALTVSKLRGAERAVKSLDLPVRVAGTVMGPNDVRGVAVSQNQASVGDGSEALVVRS